MIVGAIVLVFLHFYGVLVWEMDMKKSMFLLSGVLVLFVFYLFLINCSSKYSFQDACPISRRFAVLCGPDSLNCSNRRLGLAVT